MQILTAFALLIRHSHFYTLLRYCFTKVYNAPPTQCYYIAKLRCQV